jgi:hypothetical protein
MESSDERPALHRAAGDYAFQLPARRKLLRRAVCDRGGDGRRGARAASDAWFAETEKQRKQRARAAGGEVCEHSHKVSLALRLTLAPGPATPGATTDFIACRRGKCRCRRSEHRRRPACASAPSNACAPVSAPSQPAFKISCHQSSASLDRLIFFDCFSKRAHLRRPGQLIRSTRAPTKDRLIGKIMGAYRYASGPKLPGIHGLTKSSVSQSTPLT